MYTLHKRFIIEKTTPEPNYNSMHQLVDNARCENVCAYHAYHGLLQISLNKVITECVIHCL